MPTTSLSDIGVRGLVICEDGKFYYVTETKWRDKCALTDAPKQNGAETPQTLVDLNVALAKLSKSAFVNLDALMNLEPSDLGQEEPAQERDPEANELDEKGILLYENERYYMIPEEMWEPLAANAEGDAGVLVKRGAVVASVSANDIPTGTFCVLVNWNGLFAS
jgi:hypothetical protein